LTDWDAAAAICDVYSWFERDALVQTIRHRIGHGSVAVTMTTPTFAVSSTVTASPVYVLCILHAVCAHCAVTIHVVVVELSCAETIILLERFVILLFSE